MGRLTHLEGIVSLTSTSVLWCLINSHQDSAVLKYNSIYYDSHAYLYYGLAAIDKATPLNWSAAYTVRGDV